MRGQQGRRIVDAVLLGIVGMLSAQELTLLLHGGESIISCRKRCPRF